MRKLLTHKQIKFYQRLQIKGTKRLRKKAEIIIDNDIYKRSGYKTHGYKMRER